MNAQNLGKLLRTRKKTLATAESCTGGLLGSLITDVPGSSDYFLGGIIAYDNRVKISLLGVKKESLARHGAVSQEIASAMAKNIRKKLSSDFGIAITGIAGPDGGSKTKPVGLVYIALADKKKVIVRKNIFRGARHKIKLQAARKALKIFRLLWD